MKADDQSDTPAAEPVTGDRMTQHEAESGFDAAMDDFFSDIVGEDSDDDGGDQPAKAPAAKAPAKPAAKPAAKAPAAKPAARPTAKAPEEPAEDEEADEPAAPQATDPEADDDDVEAEDAAEKLPRDPEKFQAILDARRAKLIRAREQRDAMQAERDAALARAEELEAAGGKAAANDPFAIAPTPENPLSAVTSAEALEQTEQRWRSTLKWCQANRDGGSARGADGQPVELSAEEVAEKLAEATRYLTEYIPAQQRRRAGFAEDVKEILPKAPFLNPNHAHYQAVMASGDRLMAEIPNVMASDRYIGWSTKAILGDLIISGKYTVVHGRDGAVQLIERKPGGAPVAAAPTAPKPKPAPVRAGLPPVRPAGAAAARAERRHSDSAEDRYDADMDDFLDDIGVK